MDCSGFTGKIALVTGAGKGIGRSIAKALIKCGAVTHAVSRTKDDMDSLKEEEPEIHTHVLDVSNWDETREVVQNIGRVDLLVNNAGTGVLQHFLEVKQETWDMVMNVNLKAVMNISQVVAQGMKDRGNGGSIVNISSQASQRALPGHAVYCTSKAGVDMLTKMMALELGPHQIRVNAVNPTVVLTELGKEAWKDEDKAKSMKARIPQGKFAEVEDVVRPVLYLLSDKSDMINGATLPVDGGFWC